MRHVLVLSLVVLLAACKPQPNASTWPDSKPLPLSMSEVDAFKSQVTRCWGQPVKGPAVVIHITLLPDGAVSSAAVRPDETARYNSDPYFRAAADSALRAVRKCSPFNLPREKYEWWREVDMNFDPSHAF